MQEYLGSRGMTELDSPLLSMANGAFRRPILTKYLSTALLGIGLCPKLFSGHSFPRDAATWAASIGMPSTDIKTMGRWNRDCFRLYIDAGPKSHETAYRTLLSASNDMSSLSPSGIPQPAWTDLATVNCVSKLSSLSWPSLLCTQPQHRPPKSAAIDDYPLRSLGRQA